MEKFNVKKILILNGSPKNNNSSTLNATKAFVDGIIASTGATAEYVNLSSLKITPCTGCLSCWGRTEGECVIKNDDAISFKYKIKDADIFIESYPLQFFGMPGPMKTFTDRMLSFMNTYRGHKIENNGESIHGIRDGKNPKFIVITSCAYTEFGPVYEPLIKQYDCICGKDNYLMLFSPQLKTLIDLQNEAKIKKYLQKFYDAGMEYGKNGFLSLETQELLKKPPFSEAAYRIFLDNFWKGEKEGK